MPELPEVETIKLGLSRKIIGLKIQKVEVLSPKSFIEDPKIVQGKKVLKIERIAKLLILGLNPSLRSASWRSGNLSLVFHLKMSGQLVWKGESDQGEGKRFVGGHPTPDMVGPMPNTHTRVIFEFNDGSHLYFNDQRKFGWIKVIENLKFKIENLFGNLGPEPLEANFTWEILKENLLKHPNMPVKAVLMDQSVVSGLGNIYANEACFNATLDPRTKVSELTDAQFKKLHAGIIKSLKDGIKHGGSSRAHFVDAEGHKGYFLDYAYVYGLDKHQCKICGTEIKKIQLAGRGTYFCEHCQK